MPAVDILGRLRATALDAINKACLGEDFGFDAAPVALQGPGGGVMVLYTLILTTRSPLLGQPPLSAVAQIPSAEPTAEQVEHAVAEAMKGLREQSRKILADGHAAAVHAR